MPRLRITTSMVFCVGMGLSLASAHAQCGDLKQFRDETAGPDKFVDTFSFRRNDRAECADGPIANWDTASSFIPSRRKLQGFSL